MKLLNYASYIYWRQFERFPHGLALKLGFQPLTKAVLVPISTSPPKQQPPAGPRQLKIVEMCNALIGLCFLYALETICNDLASSCYETRFSSID
jgi:hypothetical protein